MAHRQLSFEHFLPKAIRLSKPALLRKCLALCLPYIKLIHSLHSLTCVKSHTAAAFPLNRNERGEYATVTYEWHDDEERLDAEFAGDARFALDEPAVEIIG